MPESSQPFALVVDDDPLTHAAEALECLRGPGRVDIMFSDIVTPGGMNGV